VERCLYPNTVPDVGARVDPSAYEPQFRQVARIIGERIDAGEYLPDELLPSERALAEELGTSKVTVRAGLRVLRARGRVVTFMGVGTRIANAHEVTEVTIPKGALVSARPPTEAERRRLRVAEGVPVFVIETEGGDPQVLPADRTRLRGG